MSLPRDPPLPFASPAIDEGDIAEVVETLRSGWLTTGPRVARFEQQFAEHAGTAHAVAVASCTGALHISLVASGVRPGDEVITTPITFCATAHAIVHAGGRPVFVDVEPDTGLIDCDAIEAAVGPRTAAIIPVHLAGRPCDMDRVGEIGRRHGLLVLEDAAHAVGTAWRGRRAGSLGRAGCFSFYATKAITTGEGGMVTTDDSELAARVRLYAHHGLGERTWKRDADGAYRHQQALVPGFKCNMTDVQAALGLNQLARIDDELRRRAELWDRYDSALDSLDLVQPAPLDGDAVHGRLLYSPLLRPGETGESRDRLLDELKGVGIGAGVHFAPVHLHPHYRETYSYREGDLPNAEDFGARTLSLPLSSKVTDEDADDVIEALRRTVGADAGVDAA